MIVDLTKDEIKALIVASVELNEKMPFVVEDYCQPFNLVK